MEEGGTGNGGYLSLFGSCTPLFEAGVPTHTASTYYF
jgi:hypothetical protein